LTILSTGGVCFFGGGRGWVRREPGVSPRCNGFDETSRGDSGAGACRVRWRGDRVPGAGRSCGRTSGVVSRRRPWRGAGGTSGRERGSVDDPFRAADSDGSSRCLQRARLEAPSDSARRPGGNPVGATPAAGPRGACLHARHTVTGLAPRRAGGRCSCELRGLWWRGSAGAYRLARRDRRGPPAVRDAPGAHPRRARADRAASPTRNALSMTRFRVDSGSWKRSPSGVMSPSVGRLGCRLTP
jgi:hypothetical protein